jgi:dienelactone hydrolase
MYDLDNQQSLVQLDLGGTEPVPGILQLPRRDDPVPAVLLLHGFTSHKSDMARSIGHALYLHGVASLAIDLPMHGERLGVPSDLPIRNPLALVTTWHLALREAGLAVAYLAGVRGIDRNRIAIAGYSLGAYLSVCLAAKEPGICAVALTAGGDLPSVIPFIPLVRTIVDPCEAVRQLSGRPLLLMNGKRDRRIRPEDANALFAAACEPKEQRWYDGGHWPPSSAMVDVAEWLVNRLEARPSAPSSPLAAPEDSSRAPLRRTPSRSRFRTRLDPSR